MSGQLNTPGTLTVEYLEDTGDPKVFEVASGPWCYAEWLCWKPAASPFVTIYAPIVNVATWSKTPST